MLCCVIAFKGVRKCLVNRQGVKASRPRKDESFKPLGHISFSLVPQLKVAKLYCFSSNCRLGIFLFSVHLLSWSKSEPKEKNDVICWCCLCWVQTSCTFTNLMQTFTVFSLMVVVTQTIVAVISHHTIYQNKGKYIFSWVANKCVRKKSMIHVLL